MFYFFGEKKATSLYSGHLLGTTGRRPCFAYRPGKSGGSVVN